MSNSKAGAEHLERPEIDLVIKGVRREVLSMRLRVAMALLGLVWAGMAHAFDHSHRLWGVVLEQHVTNGLVDYAALKQRPETLKKYLGELNGIEESDFKQWPKEQRLAFLINLYNASVFKLIVDNYPVGSIKDVGGWFKRPWDVDVVPLFGNLATLGYLEHGLIRKYNEPRIHFALVCGAMGCPELRREPYAAEKLDAQLTDQGQKFIRDRTKNRVHANAKTLYLSPIFKWFAEDFEKHSGSVLKFVQAYRPDIPSAEWKIRYTDYDWSLNVSSRRR